MNEKQAIAYAQITLDYMQSSKYNGSSPLHPTNSTVHDVSIEILNISAFPFKDRISFGPYGQIPPHTRSEGCFQMLDQDPKYLELLIRWRDQFGQIYESQQVIPL